MNTAHLFDLQVRTRMRVQRYARETCAEETRHESHSAPRSALLGSVLPLGPYTVNPPKSMKVLLEG